MGTFCNPSIIIISLSIIFILPSLFSPFSSVSLYCLGSWPFHSGLWVSIFLSLGFTPSPLVYVTPQIYFLLLTGVWLAGWLAVSRWTFPPSPQLAVSCVDLSTSFSGFIYPSFIGFLPILLSFFEYLILSKSLYGFSPVLSLSHSVSWYLFSLELLLLPSSKILKKKKFHSRCWLLTSVLHILLHIYMFYIVVGIIICNLTKYLRFHKIFPLLPHNICSYWLYTIPLSCTT